MADDFNDLASGLADENRLAELFRQVTASLSAVAEKARRLGDVFGAAAPTDGGPVPGVPAWPRPGLEGVPGAGPGGPLPGAPAGLAGSPPGYAQDKVAEENARANQQTAGALEELLRNGIKLRDAPPAIYSE